MLSLEPLQRAYQRLRVGFDRWQETPADEELRDAVIQRFEYTLELLWKTLRRSLREQLLNAEELEALSKRDLFRLAAQKGLLSAPEPWLEYVEARNLTSHTYNEESAQRVASLLPRFMRDARETLSRLETRHDSRPPTP